MGETTEMVESSILKHSIFLHLYMRCTSVDSAQSISMVILHYVHRYLLSKMLSMTT